MITYAIPTLANKMVNLCQNKCPFKNQYCPISINQCDDVNQEVWISAFTHDNDNLYNYCNKLVNESYPEGIR